VIVNCPFLSFISTWISSGRNPSTFNYNDIIRKHVLYYFVYLYFVRFPAVVHSIEGANFRRAFHDWRQSERMMRHLAVERIVEEMRISVEWIREEIHDFCL